MRNIMLFALMAAMGLTLTSCQGADDSQGIYQQCQDKKTVCVGIPTDCWSGSSPCSVMATIQPNSDKSKIMFRLIGMNIPRSDSYIGLGVAENGQGMADTSIVLCTNIDDVKMNVFWSATTTVPTLIGKPPYFRQGDYSFRSGKIICNFELDSKFTESNIEFDLGNKNYAILLATGNFYRDNGGPAKHDISLRISPMSLTDASSSETRPRSLLVTWIFAVFVMMVVKVWY